MGSLTQPYWRQLASSFAYPFRGSGTYALIALTIGVTLIGYLPLVGGIVATLVAGSYLLLVIQTSANGSNEPPLAQGPDEIMDFVHSALRLAIGAAVGFLPLLALSYWRGGDVMTPVEWIVGVGLGIAYLPAAMLVGAESGTFLGALNVGGALSIIMRIPVGYLFTLVFLALVAACDFASSLFVDATVAGIPFVGALVGTAAAFYFALVGSHAIGLMAHEHRAELD